MKLQKYYTSLDYIRLFACIAIFLYHLNFLNGGYLAVCIFFVLSGYLACISAFKKEKFSLLSYYRDKVLKIYFPFFIFVFITIFALSFFQEISWLNLRPETTSALLGFNNYWQLQANLDYFTKQINSPFIHLWYISIIFQFYLLFPFLFLILKKIGEHTKKIIPCIISFLLALSFAIYFYISSLNGNMMFTYYDTFSRLFSLLFGVCLGFIHAYYYPLFLPKDEIRKQVWSRLMSFMIILLFLLFFIFIDSSSSYFALSMIVVTILSCRLCDYAIVMKKERLTILDKIVKGLSSISYEIYLIQYPVIFLFQYLNITGGLKIFFIVSITLILSCLLKFSTNLEKTRKLKILRYLLCLILIGVSVIGIYKFDKAKEVTRQMQELEEQLEENETLMQEKQAQYALKLKEEQEQLSTNLEAINAVLNNLDEQVRSLSIVGIGDSVMLGAVPNLYNLFQNGYFDAKISRTAWVVEKMLKDLDEKNMLGNPIIIHLGTNGDCSESCKLDILNASKEREIFWINVTNDQNVKVNDKLQKFAQEHDNVHIIDWEKASLGHSEYFYADKIHLTETGKKAYTETIYNALYNFYLEKYTTMKNELIAQYEENKITFYSDDILLNVADELEAKLDNTQFNFEQELDYIKLKAKVEESLNNYTLGKKVIIALGNTELKKEEYEELMSLLGEREIYVVATNEKTLEVLSSIDSHNVIVINFYDKLKEHENYLLWDKIHLSKEGNKALEDMLISILKS